MEADTLTLPETRFRAMGSDCHVIVVDGPSGALDAARARVLELEQRWSRFLATSEVSQLNAVAGTPLVVSGDTLELLSTALEAREITAGRFDPSVLGDVIRSGYDRSFDDLDEEAAAAGVSDLVQGGFGVFGPSAMVAAGTGFDPGGIGKGLAADIVCREALAAGAAGICVNLGGDVRLAGRGPDGGGWPISIDHPASETPLAVVVVGEGAVATSTTLIRRWMSGGEDRHHVIDPTTRRPADTDLSLVSTIAGAAWLAEVQAKAMLIAGSNSCFDLISGSGIEALAVTVDGRVIMSPGFGRFVGEPTVSPPAASGRVSSDV